MRKLSPKSTFYKRMFSSNNYSGFRVSRSNETGSLYIGFAPRAN